MLIFCHHFYSTIFTKKIIENYTKECFMEGKIAYHISAERKDAKEIYKWK